MWQAQMLTQAARRTAHALIASLGGTSVQVRIPAPPIAGDPGEELGLRSPLFQTTPLLPVAVRPGSQHVELLVPAEVLEQTLSITGLGAVQTAVRAFAGIVVGDQVFECVDTEAIAIGGRACLYRLLLQPQGTEIT